MKFYLKVQFKLTYEKKKYNFWDSWNLLPNKVLYQSFWSLVSGKEQWKVGLLHCLENKGILAAYPEATSTLLTFPTESFSPCGGKKSTEML